MAGQCWKLLKIILNPFCNYLAVKYFQKKYVQPRSFNSEKKPTVLILRNRYYTTGSTEESTEKNHLDNSLLASGIGRPVPMTYDHDLFLPPICDIQFIKKCVDESPDLVLLSSWSEKQARHPSINAINLVRHKLGIPVIIIWWDTCSSGFMDSIKHLLGTFDLHIVVDNPAEMFIDDNEEYYERFLMLWPPQDEGLFKAGEDRDINVSFLGQISSYRSYRAEQIQFLLDAGIDGYFSTQDRDKQVAHSKYAELYSRSRMSINFSTSVSCHQFKSRILEILYSGAMLLESENEQISRYFKPYVHYIPFTDKEDLRDKIEYYDNHVEEREKIASAGYKLAREKFNSIGFWGAIFTSLGIAT